MAKERIIEAREKRNDGEIVQERKVAADDEKNLKRNKKHPGNMARRSRSEREPRHDQFDEVVPSRLEFKQPIR